MQSLILSGEQTEWIRRFPCHQTPLFPAPFHGSLKLTCSPRKEEVSRTAAPGLSVASPQTLSPELSNSDNFGEHPAEMFLCTSQSRKRRQIAKRPCPADQVVWLSVFEQFSKPSLKRSPVCSMTRFIAFAMYTICADSVHVKWYDSALLLLVPFLAIQAHKVIALLNPMRLSCIILLVFSSSCTRGSRGGRA